MNLTQKQQLLVNQYLRQVGDGLGNASDEARTGFLLRLKTYIHKELDRVSDRTLTDEEVIDLLRRFGEPAEVAARAREARKPTQRLRLSTQDARWLGVCGGLAEYTDRSSKTIRAAAVLLGLVTGPLALIAYIGLYAEMYLTADRDDVPPIRKLALARSLVGVIAGTVALHVGSRGALALLAYLYERFLEKGPPVLGAWGWLDPNAGDLLLLVLVLLVPLAVLAGLPLRNRWDATLRRVVQAGLALYALALAIGLGSALAGVILAITGEFSG
ncbi:MAG TPA: PspC domain-containing protein [Candidatus Hydrogenedentes bacterium]|nr:PspC domain-containing protein [Candidatus Hydrogenedentota bacterium]HPG69805.1 PspC domain-containing protein [Candidatus Hydrogenedentota bacterium]